eukprot:12017785-Alexandrium_andersonii.AAC.1
MKAEHKLMPRDWEQLTAAVAERAKSKGRGCSMTAECSFEDIEAVRAAHAALYENERTRDDSAVADAVLPFIAKNFCESF